MDEYEYEYEYEVFEEEFANLFAQHFKHYTVIDFYEHEIQKQMERRRCSTEHCNALKRSKAGIDRIARSVVNSIEPPQFDFGEEMIIVATAQNVYVESHLIEIRIWFHSFSSPKAEIPISMLI
jgi:hypothetical protein